MDMARFRKVFGFLFLWLLSWIFWSFLIRAFSTHHPNNPIVQGLVTDTIA